MIDTFFINELTSRRQEYGVFNKTSYLYSTRKYLCRIENGKAKANEELRKERLKQ